MTCPQSPQLFGSETLALVAFFGLVLLIPLLVWIVEAVRERRR